MHLRAGPARWSVALAILSLVACSGDDDAVPTTTPVDPTAAAPTSTLGSLETVPGVAPATPPPPSFTTPASVFDDTGGFGGSSLYDVALATGGTELLGVVGTEIGVLGIAAAADGSIDAVTDAPALLVIEEAALDQAVPGTPVDAAGATLLALARRPSDGALFAVGDGGEIVQLDPATGTTTAVAAIDLDDPGIGLDVTDDGVLEVVVATGRRFEVDPAGGTVSELPPLTGDVTVPRIVAVAHRGQDRYGIDSAADTLVGIADDGTVTTVGPLGVDVTDGASFDMAVGGARLANPG